MVADKQIYTQTREQITYRNKQREQKNIAYVHLNDKQLYHKCYQV